MAAVLAIGGVLLLAALAVILNGWALHHLWAWFIVPVFAAPSLGIAQSLGLASVVGFMTAQHVHDERTAGERIGTTLLAPFFALGIGWIIKQFL